MDEVFIRRVANPNPGDTGAEITPRGRNGQFAGLACSGCGSVEDWRVNPWA